MQIIEAIAWGIALGAFAVLLAGVRRLPWGYATVVGFGSGVVMAALRSASLGGVDLALLVLIAALGASLATVASERGSRERVRRSASILAGRPSPPA